MADHELELPGITNKVKESIMCRKNRDMQVLVLDIYRSLPYDGGYNRPNSFYVEFLGQNEAIQDLEIQDEKDVSFWFGKCVMGVLIFFLPQEKIFLRFSFGMVAVSLMGYNTALPLAMHPLIW